MNQNLLVFGFFLLISSVFWFFNALNKEYYADLDIPVRYINMPENKLVAGSLARNVKVKITAFGHQVMNYKTSSIKSAIINLNQHSLHPVSGSNNKRFYILTSSIKAEIANVLGPDVEIKSIAPDSLIFRLEEVVVKKVPVKTDLKINFQKQYMLKGSVVVKPDSVVIKGVKSVLDTIDELKTVFKELDQVDDSMDIMLEMVGIQGTEITPQMVNCVLPVEKFTELSYKLPIDIQNPPPGYSVKLFPSDAKVTCNVGFSKYQFIYMEQFQLVADFSSATDSEEARLRIKLNKAPQDVSNVRIYPQSVDFIIEKND